MATTEETLFNQVKPEFETNIINGNENGNSILDNVKNEYDQNNFNNNDNDQNHQEENGNQDEQNENNGHYNEQNNGNGNEQDDNNFMSQGNVQQNYNENENIDDGNNGQNEEELNNNGNSQMEPEQFRKVFIGGLSYKTDDETLKNYFSKYGELVDYVVMKDSQSGRSRGFGFVTYSYSSMVDELMKNRPHIIDGRQVEPKRATPREDSGKTEVQMTVKKLFIGGLRDNITEDDLKSYFNNYGNVIEAVVMKEKETNKSRGFGFVTFDDYDPVDKIILEKHHSINGVNVHTQKALPKDFEKNQGNNNNNRGNFRNDNNNFNGNNNYNGGNFNNNSNNNNFQRFNNNNFQMQRNNQFQNGNNNSSLNNTYGSYNQAPNKPKMNDGNMNQNNMMMNNNQMNNRNNKMGGGPMRGGHGRFTNRSSGPYGGGGGFNNGNNNNFNNNRGRIGGRGGIGQRGASQRENNNNNNNNNLSNSNNNMNTMSN